ncbi:MAG: hypothetical protein JXK94_01095 [Deltaproteobacteria bacterium]|nr:hypothetical protein [Deltaproteobacteria bacterium]
MYFQDFNAALEKLRQEGGFIKHHFAAGKFEIFWEVSHNIGCQSELDNFITTCHALAKGGLTEKDVKKELKKLHFNIPGWTSDTLREKYIHIVMED